MESNRKFKAQTGKSEGKEKKGVQYNDLIGT